MHQPPQQPPRRLRVTVILGALIVGVSHILLCLSAKVKSLKKSLHLLLSERDLRCKMGSNSLSVVEVNNIKGTFTPSEVATKVSFMYIETFDVKTMIEHQW